LLSSSLGFSVARTLRAPQDQSERVPDAELP
jgi:hypothetical protein